LVKLMRTAARSAVGSAAPPGLVVADEDEDEVPLDRSPPPPEHATRVTRARAATKLRIT
jgi:hypothetical protein